MNMMIFFPRFVDVVLLFVKIVLAIGVALLALFAMYDVFKAQGFGLAFLMVFGLIVIMELVLVAIIVAHVRYLVGLLFKRAFVFKIDHLGLYDNSSVGSSAGFIPWASITSLRLSENEKRIEVLIDPRVKADISLRNLFDAQRAHYRLDGRSWDLLMAYGDGGLEVTLKLVYGGFDTAQLLVQLDRVLQESRSSSVFQNGG